MNTKQKVIKESDPKSNHIDKLKKSREPQKTPNLNKVQKISKLPKATFYEGDKSLSI